MWKTWLCSFTTLYFKILLLNLFSHTCNTAEVRLFQISYPVGGRNRQSWGRSSVVECANNSCEFGLIVALIRMPYTFVLMFTLLGGMYLHIQGNLEIFLLWLMNRGNPEGGFSCLIGFCPNYIFQINIYYVTWSSMVTAVSFGTELYWSFYTLQSNVFKNPSLQEVFFRLFQHRVSSIWDLRVLLSCRQFPKLELFRMLWML